MGRNREGYAMQKVITGVGVVWLLVVLGGFSVVSCQPAASNQATEGSTWLGKDLFLTVGLDVWPHQWQTGTAPVFGVNAQSVSTIGVGLIPTIGLRYKENFFLTASYMWTPDYDFGKTVATGFLANGSPQTFEADLTATRQEADFIIGYSPLDWLGIAIGYKGIFRDYSFRHVFHIIPPSPTFDSLDNYEVKTYYNGPIFGLVGGTKIKESGFSIAGNAFGGYLFTSCSRISNNTPSTPPCPQVSNGPYAATKLWLRYNPTTLPQLSFTLGYRVQLINTDIKSTSSWPRSNFESTGLDLGPNTSNVIDITHGPIFGLAYGF
jgi:hypothetical protein